MKKRIKTKSARQKGKDFEDLIADKLVEKGLDSKARRDGGSGSGNREKADVSTSATIFGRNLGIEAKNYENLAIPDWWRQTEKLEVLGREPVLIFKLPKRNPKVQLVTIYLDTFLDMLVALQGVDDTSSNVVENYGYDKNKHLEDLLFLKTNLARYINNFKKKILKED